MAASRPRWCLWPESSVVTTVTGGPRPNTCGTSVLGFRCVRSSASRTVCHAVRASTLGLDDDVVEPPGDVNYRLRQPDDPSLHVQVRREILLLHLVEGFQLLYPIFEGSSSLLYEPLEILLVRSILLQQSLTVEGPRDSAQQLVDPKWLRHVIEQPHENSEHFVPT